MGSGFGKLTPYNILQRLRKLYGRATMSEIETKLNLLNNPMDRNLPIEDMIRMVEDDASSLAESIVQYAERATTAEGKVSNLESRLAALEMGLPKAPPQTAYYMPHHMAYYGQGHPPHHQQSTCHHRIGRPTRRNTVQEKENTPSTSAEVRDNALTTTKAEGEEEVRAVPKVAEEMPTIIIRRIPTRSNKTSTFSIVSHVDMTSIMTDIIAPPPLSKNPPPPTISRIF